MSDIQHFVGNRSPSLSDTIRVDGAPFPLTTSTVKLKMRPEGSTTLKVNAAAVVTDAPNGAVRYDWAAADVDTSGEYLAWWEVTLPSGKTQDTREFTVTMLDHAQQTRVLCELEDVTDYAPGYQSDAVIDAALQQLILAKSREWHQMSGREFVAISPVFNTRRFDVTDAVLNLRRLRIGDATTVSTVTLIDLDQSSTVQTVATPNYILEPRIRQEWEPITSLFFPWATSGAVYPIPGQVFEIVGVWGFPIVPADIRQGVAGMVVYDYLTKVAEQGTAFAEAVTYGAVNVGALYARGQSVLESYALPQVA